SFRPSPSLTNWPDYTFLGVKNVAVQADGKVLVSAAYSYPQSFQIDFETLTRLNNEGSFDSTFDLGTGVDGNIQALALQPDGKILIAGWFFDVNGARRSTIARLESNGRLDASFDPQAGASYYIEDIAVQPDGKIVIGGDFTQFNGVYRQ